MKFLAVLSFVISNMALARATPATERPFSSQLLHAIVSNKSSENVIFSPVSVESCLALAFLGARGATAEELKTTLQLRGDSREAIAEHFNEILQKQQSEEAKLKFTSRMYVDQRFQLDAKFNEIATKYFEAAAENVDFSQSVQTASQINAWVEQQTENKIKNLLSPSGLDANTAAVLVNAIYFKANWTNQFESYATKKQSFALTDANQVTVDMMSQEDFFLYGDLADLQATALEMSYEGTDLAMLVILPKAIDGLAALETKLKDIDLTKVSAGFKSEKVNLKLPKFKLDFDISLKPVLEYLGIKAMFTSGADFTNLLSSPNEQPPVSVAEVKHKAFIEVNEKGTEAAAATFVKMDFQSLVLNEQIYDFVVDHPFFFAIKDKQHVYFAGHVVKF